MSPNGDNGGSDDIAERLGPIIVVEAGTGSGLSIVVER